ncbi:hypothetical protein QBC33DRAFT_454409 [Phialemonium atrogriseum]|uniref:C3H1-type domain-containing protein n=1 Tax=Phialemonium atrogriseum TaxID=1093897 RepID=A0AAJ0C0U3_9PEZI|nr:uncharacterized protein QBC33DRAFT_454409 [Phialemonium atrogriseum]KAK1765606.1 hypothetical protein QBC33DRAFT_454409 [Phialemonium atrogriseum]
MNGNVESYLHRLEAFRRADFERDAMLAELVKSYHDLHVQYQQKCIDYEDAVESRRSWQSKATQSSRDLGEIQRANESNQFIFAIIDGDGAYFRDDLIARGDEGGEEAAQRLLSDIKRHVKDIYPGSNVEDWSVIVQVVLNQTGLSKTLFERGIVKNPNVELPAFARAFGRTQALFSFVDVGAGKERADHKIREMMRVMVRVTQCKHILFGPCLDNGYLPFLGEYKGNTSASPRITLLETSPAGPGFQSLGFRHVSFPDVFRSAPLPERPVMQPPPRPISTSPVPVSAIAATPGSSVTSAIENGSSAGWAALSKSVAASKAKTINIAPKKPAQLKHYTININGERLDEELSRWDPSAEKRFANRIRERGNCCNFYHLRGKCPEEEFCGYYHGDRLGPAELLVLRHKARSLKCSNGTYCSDPECFYGHHCRFGKNCSNSSCRFADTHHVDLHPATKIYEDGTEKTVL